MTEITVDQHKRVAAQYAQFEKIFIKTDTYHRFKYLFEELLYQRRAEIEANVETERRALCSPARLGAARRAWEQHAAHPAGSQKR